MSAIELVMKRLGYVRLSRYGLVLTPEGRVVSLRPTVLDDGLGGKIVGWQDGDLAAMELGPWEPARPASRAAVAPRLAAPATGPAVATAAPVAASRPPAPAAPATARVHAGSAPAVTVEVAEDEEEWEWMLALARARATAEPVAPVASVAPRPVMAEAAPRRRGETLPPPVATHPTTTNQTSIAARPAIPTSARPGTRPATPPAAPTKSPIAKPTRVAVPSAPPPAPVARPSSVVAPVARVAPVAPVASRPILARPPTTPPTVIPIPKLPSIPKARVEPVARATATPAPPARTLAPVVVRGTPAPGVPVVPRRIAKGTGPVLPAIVASLTPRDRAVAPSPAPILPVPPAASKPLPSILARG